MQNTAYDLRISGWSSDLCSSDLQAPLPGDEVRLAAARDAVVDGLRDPLRHRLRLPGLHGRQPGALPGRRSRLSAKLRIFMSEFPSTAKAVVIGGGIVGCSTAYHLGKLGWTATVLARKSTR